MGSDGNDPFPWLLLIGWTLSILAPILIAVWAILHHTR